MMAAKHVVLNECIDPDFEPSEEGMNTEYNKSYWTEVLQYAKFLGMDVKNDRDLIWIAREGLKAPLPPSWKAIKEEGKDRIYYFNFQTAESLWDHPCDQYYKNLYKEEKLKKLNIPDSRPINMSSSNKQHPKMTADTEDGIHAPKVAFSVSSPSHSSNKKMYPSTPHPQHDKEKSQPILHMDNESDLDLDPMEEIASISEGDDDEEIERGSLSDVSVDDPDLAEVEQEEKHMVELQSQRLQAMKTMEDELARVKIETERLVQEHEERKVEWKHKMAELEDLEIQKHERKHLKKIEAIKRELQANLDTEKIRLEAEYKVSLEDFTIRMKQKYEEEKKKVTKEIDDSFSKWCSEKQRQHSIQLEHTKKNLEEEFQSNCNALEREYAKKLEAEEQKLRNRLEAKQAGFATIEQREIEYLKEVSQQRIEAEKREIEENADKIIANMKQQQNAFLIKKSQELQDQRKQLDHLQEFFDKATKQQQQQIQQLETHFQETIENISKQVTEDPPVDLRRVPLKERSHQINLEEERAPEGTTVTTTRIPITITTSVVSGQPSSTIQDVPNGTTVTQRHSVLVPVPPSSDQGTPTRKKVEPAPPPAEEEEEENLYDMSDLHSQLTEEEQALRRLKKILHDRLALMKQKQEELIQSRKEWKKNMKQLQHVPKDSEDYKLKHTLLMNMKLTLEEQTSELNRDIREINHTKEWIATSEEKLAALKAQITSGN